MRVTRRELAAVIEHAGPGAAMSIEVGQVYASTHSGDVKHGERQRRRVVAVDMAACKVHLRTETTSAAAVVRPSTVTLRSPQSRTIPGHRLVEGAPPPDLMANLKASLDAAIEKWARPC